MLSPTLANTSGWRPRARPTACTSLRRSTVAASSSGRMGKSSSSAGVGLGGTVGESVGGTGVALACTGDGVAANV